MRHLLSRIMAVLAVVAASAVGTAIVLAILDIYLTGHGHQSVHRTLISWPAAGVSLSIADFVWLTVVSIAAFVAWQRFWRSEP